MTGSELRTRRQQMGLSQQQLGWAIDRPAFTVSRWERGEMAIEAPGVLQFLLRHLDADLVRERPAPADLETWLKSWLERESV